MSNLGVLITEGTIMRTAKYVPTQCPLLDDACVGMCGVVMARRKRQGKG